MAAQLYAGSKTLSGATLVFDRIVNVNYPTDPLIGVRITNASTANDVWIFVDGVHGLPASSGFLIADFIATPSSYGERVGPGKTVEFWASGGGSKPGAGMINRIYASGTDGQYITWSAIAR